MRKSEMEELLRKIGELVADYHSKGDSADSEPESSTCDGNTNPGELSKALQPREHSRDAVSAANENRHVYAQSTICATDERGRAEATDRSPLEIVVDATDGFVPLWAQGQTLKLKFNESSMRYFRYPEAAKRALRTLLARAMHAWGDAAPIKLKERRSPGDTWDFQVTMMRRDDCDASGCTLASAFFPDGGRHHLRLYPELFRQSQQEWVETLVHELGHVFGLRHFFANVTERRWASEIFGDHQAFSIMNYGAMSQLTEADKSDLKNLYRLVWSGELTNVNGTPIRLFRPFSVSGIFANGVAVA